MDRVHTDLCDLHCRWLLDDRTLLDVVACQPICAAVAAESEEKTRSESSSTLKRRLSEVPDFGVVSPRPTSHPGPPGISGHRYAGHLPKRCILLSTFLAWHERQMLALISVLQCHLGRLRCHETTRSTTTSATRSGPGAGTGTVTGAGVAAAVVVVAATLLVAFGLS